MRNIAKEEGVSAEELDRLSGTGKDGRITKKDILAYIDQRKSDSGQTVEPKKPAVTPAPPAKEVKLPKVPVFVNGGDEIIEMDRMRKLISGYMVNSLQPAHVQSLLKWT